MEYKAKITQIIKGEDYKKYGFWKYPNCDYINLMPIEKWNENNRKFNKVLRWINTALIILVFILFPLGNVIKNDFMIWVGIILFIAFIFFNLWYSDYRERKIFGRYWYFDKPFPIKKPHNFKEGDDVKINIILKKIMEC